MKGRNIAKWLACGVCVCLCILFSGCASEGEQAKTSGGTGVDLNQSNFKLLAPSVSGVSRGFYLFGFIPIVSPKYSAAKRDLYATLGETTGQSVVGRSIALTNQTEDKGQLYLILFSIPSLTLTADVIEFTHQAK